MTTKKAPLSRKTNSQKKSGKPSKPGKGRGPKNGDEPIIVKPGISEGVVDSLDIEFDSKFGPRNPRPGRTLRGHQTATRVSKVVIYVNKAIFIKEKFDIGQIVEVRIEYI